MTTIEELQGIVAGLTAIVKQQEEAQKATNTHIANLTEALLAHRRLACDHALSLYLCNLFSRGGHDTILSQIRMQKSQNLDFFLIG